MRFLIRALLFLIVIGGLAAGGAYFFAGTQAGPSFDVRSPEKYVGQNTPLEFFVETPGGQFSRVDAALEQEGQSTTVFSNDSSQSGAEVKTDETNRLWIIRPIGKQALPNAQSRPGAADDHRVAPGALRPAHRRDARSRATSRCGSSRRASACSRCITSSTTAARSSSSFAPRRPTSTAGVRVGDVELSRAFPAAASASQDPGAARRVLRARLRPGP